MFLTVNFSNLTLIITLIIVVLLLFFILVAIKFQTKQKKKYNECLKLIKDKEKGISSLTPGIDLDKINKDIDADKLMMKLYDVYLAFIEKLNKNDKDFEGILEGFIKEFYENKIDIYKNKKHVEVTDNIELVNYSILEYEDAKIKFRINITCFNYKLNNDKVISGSNLERVDQIFIITYSKSNKKWLINNIEKVFEKKLSI